METQKRQKKQCDVKTDLNLLLECLKYQMDCPLSQKDTLITIYSICQQNSEASEYFREIGGLMFVNDLAKSSIHGIVKEAALFTLGITMESNVYCQQTLCTAALFEDLISFLINKNSGVNLKRMSVYVILALVSNNISGQTYVRDTGCIGLLLQLFRTTLSASEINLSDEDTNQCYQLWSSVCSTLCACVNNPQNEYNQNICSSVFPYAKEWLECCTKPEIVRPICSFVGLTVANNSYVQKYFVSVGGLDTLARVLTRLTHDSNMSHSSIKLAIAVTKTLDACVANDSTIGIVLTKYHTVSELLKLLSNDTLDTREKISIILTIGHCTEVCEENQCELLQNNGLPLMIQLLTESQDEELNKVATFVLKNCKQMTKQLFLKINYNSLNATNTEELDMQVRKRSLEDYWKEAKEILYRTNLLEKECNEESAKGGVFVERSSEASAEASKYCEVNPADPETYIARTHKEIHCPQSDDQVLSPSVNSSALKNEIVNPMNLVNASVRQSEQRNSLCSVNELQTDSVLQSHSINERTTCVKNQSIQVSEQLFKKPAEIIKNVKQTCTSDQHSEITKGEKSTSATSTSQKMADFRCSGCKAGELSFNSKTFTKVLQSCPYQCDHHKVILEAEERRKKELLKLTVCNNRRYAASEKILLTPEKKQRLHTETPTFRSRLDSSQKILLTPKKKKRVHAEIPTFRSEMDDFQSIILTPDRKKQSNTSNRDGHSKNASLANDCNLIPTYKKSLQKSQDANSNRQRVKEMRNLECQCLKENHQYSVERDEKGRTNVDPSKKYYRLQLQR
ncbi:telomere repeats-binding bouquet formation protein 1 isoform X1 [Pezoporus flaviventris]|uniref:telomere repeats-binding bouquet formation protein 1 isoform X1 n=1 Tax=Pezoporus flaviventris TaxID=889875 RepID=UPI002AB31E3B|nr:telomere repeats-binding bouquet formation protein 1 isoform X1 [Pezoporus flaviventris]